MLTFLRFLARLFKKDFQLLSNYERSHPHFFWYLGIDAVLSVAIVSGGYTLYAHSTSDSHQLKHVGAEVMTSQEVIEHANEFNVVAYWLGAIPGYEYTMDHSETGIADVFYWQKGTHDTSEKLFLYEVKTYRNQKAWDSRSHTFLATTNTETITVNKDVTIRINPTSMRGVIATFISKPEIVALAYPAPQKLQDMVKNVVSLRMVQ
ncbi:MAG: hypothetical protein Q8K86_11190 [Candidatus Nanopelagicaceae bacterium]|nr:hypothetical protein [Candidatus Nanopelagicaceae bacterium]